MPRLVPGQNEKIDNINRLVDMALSDNEDDSKHSIESLLTMFHPMLLKLCNKWAIYFDDNAHTVITWDELMADARYWFIKYTKDKYIVDGRATYNKFMKDHMDQRIRYIYEERLRYMKHNIFPDPDKNDLDGGEMFDEVVSKYSDAHDSDESHDDILIDDERLGNIGIICDAILSRVDDRAYFTEREAIVFKACFINGKTHDDIANELGISRPRVSQMVGKIRGKVLEILDDNVRGWEEMPK
jgi:hypothetical protein